MNAETISEFQNIGCTIDLEIQTSLWREVESILISYTLKRSVGLGEIRGIGGLGLKTFGTPAPENPK